MPGCIPSWLHLLVSFLCPYFLTASIFLEDSEYILLPYDFFFPFAPWDQRPDKLYMDSHQFPDAFHTENESVVSARESGRGGDTINGIQVTCKPEFTVSSLDSSALIISQKNHCLWYRFFFFFLYERPFFPPRFHTVFPLLALPNMVF